MQKTKPTSQFLQTSDGYRLRLQEALSTIAWSDVERLANTLLDCFHRKGQVFICGNGGSGANAIHIANDFLYGITKTIGSGMRCRALVANTSIITCLANDEGYDKVFAFQIAAEADPGDLLLVLSGSGNSPNVISAIHEAKKVGMSTFAILGFDGGLVKSLVGTAIHADVQDMQISEHR